MQRRYLNGLVLLVLVLGCISCGQDQNTTPRDTIKIAYLPITHALPVLMQYELAQKKTPDSSPLRVELIRYGSWPELMDALNTGRVDGASVLEVLAVKAQEQGIRLRAAALGHHGGNVVIVANDINSTHDLKGKIIAVPHRQSSHNLLIRQMIHDASLDENDVQIIELSPAEMPPALARGVISAYCVAEPFGARAVELGAGKVLLHANDLWPDALCCTLVFNERFLLEHRQLAERYVLDYLRAGKAIASNPELTQSLCEKELNISKPALEMSLGWISFSNLAITPKDYNELTSRMQQWGLSENPPAFDEVVDAALATLQP